MLRDGERLVVLTQTCDLIKPPELFPMVDLGLVIATENPALLAEADNLGSARRYRLSPRENAGAAQILDFGWRCQADKGIFVQSAPDNSVVDGWGDREKARFARWLGRRYSRPVLSDEDAAQIHEPIRKAWKQAEIEELENLADWNNEFAEIRFLRRAGNEVHLYLLSPEAQPDGELGTEMLEWLAEALEGQGFAVTGEIYSYDSFSVTQLEATQQVDIDWASDDEGEVSGVPPAVP